MSDRDVIDLNSVETLFRSDSSNPQLTDLLNKYSVLSIERCSTNRYTRLSDTYRHYTLYTHCIQYVSADLYFDQSLLQETFSHKKFKKENKEKFEKKLFALKS